MPTKVSLFSFFARATPLTHSLPRALLRRLNSSAPIPAGEDLSPLPPPHFPPDELGKMRFTRDHMWVKLTEDGLATVGISEYASKTLGDVAFAELPRTHHKIQAKDSIGALESVKASAELYSPVSGSIWLVNNELTIKPSLVSKSPLDKGWFCKIKFVTHEDVEKLMTAEEYQKFLDASPPADESN